MLETWIANEPSILGLEIVIIGRQVVTDFGGKIDLLAIDRDGNLTILELKRDRTPREIVAQILDYASWASTLTTKELYTIASKYKGEKLDSIFSDGFDSEIPEKLNTSHNMVIVASELDEPSRRIVEYLSTVHNVSINTLFFNTFDYQGTLMMGADWLMDQEEVVERSTRRVTAPWSGYWYVNADDCSSRSWDDCRRCGFLGAGGGTKYSDQLKRLSVGDRVFVYQKKSGYVGYGVVTKSSEPAREFMVDGKPLSKCVKSSPDLLNHPDEPDLQEYVIGVDWRKTFAVQEAKTFAGIFASPNVVCKLRDTKTLDFLKEAFDAPSDPS
jgi:hypothetical protein